MRSILAMAFLLLARVVGAQVQASTTQVAGTFPNFTSPGTWTGAQTFLPGSLLDKGNMVFNVQAYGVDCADNANNDAAFVRAAGTACSHAGGGRVWVPPNCAVNLGDDGTILSGSFLMYDGCELAGASQASSQILGDTTGNPFEMVRSVFQSTCAGGSGAVTTCMDQIKPHETNDQTTHGTRGPGCPCFHNADCQSASCVTPSACSTPTPPAPVGNCDAAAGQSLRGGQCPCTANPDCLSGTCSANGRATNVVVRDLAIRGRKNAMMEVVLAGTQKGFVENVVLDNDDHTASGRNYGIVCGGGQQSTIDFTFSNVQTGVLDVGALLLPSCNENNWLEFQAPQSSKIGVAILGGAASTNRFYGGIVQSRGNGALCTGGFCVGGVAGGLLYGSPQVCTSNDQCPEAGVFNYGLYSSFNGIYQEDVRGPKYLMGRASKQAACTADGVPYPCCSANNAGCPAVQAQAWSIENPYSKEAAHVAFAALAGLTTDGQWNYCTDCNVASPCTGGGAGAYTERKAGAWDCTVDGGNFFVTRTSSGEELNLSMSHDSNAQTQLWNSARSLRFGEITLKPSATTTAAHGQESCSATNKGALFYDSDVNEPCFCNGVSYCKISAPGTCGNSTSCN